VRQARLCEAADEIDTCRTASADVRTKISSGGWTPSGGWMPSYVQCYDELINHRREVSSPISSGCCHFFGTMDGTQDGEAMSSICLHYKFSRLWDWLIFFVAYWVYLVRSWMRTNDGSVH